MHKSDFAVLSTVVLPVPAPPVIQLTALSKQVITASICLFVSSYGNSSIAEQ